MKLKTIAAAIVASAVISGPVLAANGAPSGPHYNLNIIGVDASKAKKTDMTGSNRHTIFMPLVSTKSDRFSSDGTALVDAKIWLTPGYDFQVCDGNGFDMAYGCDIEDYPFDQEWNGTVFLADGTEVQVAERKNGAVFALPCNTNIFGLADTDGDGDKDDEVELISCNMTVDTTDGTLVPVEDSDIVPTMNYEVWIRALGKPGGSATMTTCATVQGDVTCSSENVILSRPKGKNPEPPVFKEVTDELTSVVVQYCWKDCNTDDPDYRTTRVALFAGDTEDWFWNFDNKGLRLTQIRFYEVPQD